MNIFRCSFFLITGYADLGRISRIKIRWDLGEGKSVLMGGNAHFNRGKSPFDRRIYTSLHRHPELVSGKLCKMEEEFKYKELTGKIIGCAMKVHSHFGSGFPESIYER